MRGIWLVLQGLFMLLAGSRQILANVADSISIRSISIGVVEHEIIIDGKLAEVEWTSEPSGANFSNNFPTDNGQVRNSTEVRLAYNEDFFYLSAVCYFSDFTPVVQSLKRDNSWWYSDSFSLVVDPAGKQSVGMLFNVNAGGAQADALVGTQGIFASYDANWDAQWYSAVTVYENHWVAEIAIPFQMLRYDRSNGEWLINFVRHDMQSAHTTCWNHVPVSYDNYHLQYMGKLIWDSSPPPSNGGVSLIPFVTTGIQSPSGEKVSTHHDMGLDGKIAIKTNLNLDFTINPDFSQIDVDQQVINLTRFDVSLPERRLFFMENSDLFATMGIPSVRPFFSRKIGLKNGSTVPLLGGLRLTGNLNSKLRIGLLSTLEQEVKDTLNRVLSAGAFQYTLNNNSILQGLLTSIESLDKYDIREFDYGRTGGLEYKYFTRNRKWNFAARYHRAFRKNIVSDNQFFQLGMTHNVSHWFIDINWIDLQKHFASDLAFTPRLYQYDPITDRQHQVAYKRNFNEVLYRIFSPRSRRVAFHGPHVKMDNYFRIENHLNESDISLLYEFKFRNRSLLSGGVRNNFVRLIYPSRILSTGQYEPLPAEPYSFYSAELSYDSPPASALRYTIRADYGSFYNGMKLGVNTTISARLKTWINVHLNYTYSNIEFPSKYGSKEIHLVVANMELLFSTRMFWTTFIQYNTQLRNVNINSRFQWRFRPLSDLFVIYSGNYTDSFFSGNQGLVVKVTYRFNPRVK